MKKLFIFLLTTVFLFADTHYPELFETLGTPLYKADKAFSKLPENQQYSFAVDTYHTNQKHALELSQAGDKGAYLKALRKLAKEHQEIIAIVKREMVNAMRNDEYSYFIALNNVGLEDLYQQQSFKEQTYTYYLANRDTQQSPYLEKRIRSEKGYQKLYGVDISSNSYNDPQSSSHHERPSKVILLSRPGCGYCVKAKKFMNEKGIAFTEYNILSSSRGKSLFAKYQGTGVPLIIIGDEVIRGYSESSILSAL